MIPLTNLHPPYSFERGSNVNTKDYKELTHNLDLEGCDMHLKEVDLGRKLVEHLNNAFLTRTVPFSPS